MKERVAILIGACMTLVGGGVLALAVPTAVAIVAGIITCFGVAFLTMALVLGRWRRGTAYVGEPAVTEMSASPSELPGARDRAVAG